MTSWVFSLFMLLQWLTVSRCFSQWKGFANEGLNASVVNTSNNSSCKTTRIGLRRCETYRFTHCKPILKYYNATTVSINCTEKQERADAILTKISSTLLTYYGASDECLKGSLWSLCLMSMPPGCNRTVALRAILCKEACVLVRDRLCYNEWKKIESLKRNGILSDDIQIPDCNIFPSMKQKNQSFPCLYPELLKDLEKIYKTKNQKKSSGNNTILIASVAGGGGLFLIIVVAVIVMCRKTRTKNNQRSGVSLENLPKGEFFDGVQAGYSSNIACTEDNPLYTKESGFDNINVETVPREWLRYIEPLAEGAFGKVVKCEFFSPNTKEKQQLTAVKYLKDDASPAVKSSFIKEAETLASFQHPNIVSLLGICTDNKGPLCMILEFMRLGDLTQYVRARSGSYHASYGQHGVLPDEVDFKPPEISFRKLINMAKQIASGMAYLAERRFVHRDLASRNCLLDNDDLVKIADFGLAHDISSSESDYYRIDGQRLLPIRWLPPEALTVGKFTVHSDIWAFGVLMWELFSYGLQPYYGQTNDEVCDRIRCLKLLNRPDGCPQRVYQVMKSCWKYDPTKRTPFSKINETLTLWAETGKGQFLDDAWNLMLKPVPIERAPTLPVKMRPQK